MTSTTIDEFAWLQRACDDWYATRSPPRRVLDAGCGRTTRIGWPGTPRRIGIDLADRQVRNHEALDLGMIADVRHQPLASGSIDALICFNVLEHVPAPAAAVAEFGRVTAPGGLVIIGVPDPRSLKGLVTRWTPHALHLLFYRWIVGDPTATGADTAQFPTVLDPLVAPGRLQHALRAAGFRIVADLHYEGPVSRHVRAQHRSMDIVLAGVAAVGRWLTLGRWRPLLSDLIVIAVREEASATR